MNEEAPKTEIQDNNQEKSFKDRVMNIMWMEGEEGKQQLNRLIQEISRFSNDEYQEKVAHLPEMVLSAILYQACKLAGKDS